LGGVAEKKMPEEGDGEFPFDLVLGSSFVDGGCRRDDE